MILIKSKSLGFLLIFYLFF